MLAPSVRDRQLRPQPRSHAQVSGVIRLCFEDASELRNQASLTQVRSSLRPPRRLLNNPQAGSCTRELPGQPTTRPCGCPWHSSLFNAFLDLCDEKPGGEEDDGPGEPAQRCFPRGE